MDYPVLSNISNQALDLCLRWTKHFGILWKRHLDSLSDGLPSVTLINVIPEVEAQW